MTSPSLERIAARSPPLFDARFLAALTLPALAAACLAAALAREQIADGPTDPASLLLRVVAYALAVVAIHHLIVVGKRVALFATHRRHALALREDALLVTSARGDVHVAKADILAVVEPGAWGGRKGARRWSDVYVVLHPRAGQTHVTLPPVFELSSGELCEHLMRWRGPVARQEDGEDQRQLPEPASLPSKVYDEAARTGGVKGGFVIGAGYAWLARGPYATTLLGVSIVDGFVRATPAVQMLLAPEMVAIVAAALFLVPVVWLLVALREMRPKRGLALVLTPAEALLRAESGVVSVPFRALARVGLEERRAWSVVLGIYRSRAIVIERKDAPTIRYDEAFLGAPADVVVALLEAGKRGALG